MKIFAYKGAHMAHSLELNIKLLSVNMSARNVVIILVGMVLFG